MRTKNISVLIPARNEEGTVGKLVTLLLACYGRVIKEVIIVDDGSADNTKTILAGMAKRDRRIKTVYRTSPHGVGLAIRDGLRRVSPDATHVLTMDADFVRNIPDLEDFFSEIDGWDGLIGSRYKERHLLIRYPLLKRIANRAFHLIIRLLFGITNTDLTNNFKLYKKEIFKKIPLRADDYAVNAETGLYPILMGYRIGELPVPWFARQRSMGVSKFRLASLLPSYIAVLRRAMLLKKTGVTH